MKSRGEATVTITLKRSGTLPMGSTHPAFNARHIVKVLREMEHDKIGTTWEVTEIDVKQQLSPPQ